MKNKKQILILLLLLSIFVVANDSIAEARGGFRAGGGGFDRGGFASRDVDFSGARSSGFFNSGNNFQAPEFKSRSVDNLTEKFPNRDFNGGYMVPDNINNGNRNYNFDANKQFQNIDNRTNNIDVNRFNRNDVINNNNVDVNRFNRNDVINNNNVDVNRFNRNDVINNNNIDVNRNNVIRNNNNNVIISNRSINNYPDWNVYHNHVGPYWRGFWNGYNYHYPWGVALGASLVALPMTAIALACADQPDVNYYYNEGVYYVQSPSGYQVTQPPSGVTVNKLPDGMIPVTVAGQKYYYYFGTFYSKQGNQYMVIDSPVGAVVPYIPDGFQEIDNSNGTMLKVANTYFVPQQQNGNTVFQVVNPGTT